MKRIISLLAVLLFVSPVGALWSEPSFLGSVKSPTIPDVINAGKEIFVLWKNESSLYFYTFYDGNISTMYSMDNVTATSYAACYDGENIHLVFVANGSINYMKMSKTGDVYKYAVLHTLNAMEVDIAVDSMGRVHVVWSEDRGDGYQIYYGVLQQNFTEKKLTNTTYQSRRPRLVVDSMGYVHIMYYEVIEKLNKRIGYIRLYNNRVVERKILKEKYAYWESIVIDDADHIHAVWQDGKCGKGNILYLEMDRNGSEIIKKIISAGDDMKPSIFYRNDKEYITWYTHKALYYAVVWNGSILKEKVHSLRDAHHPQIGVDGKGVVYIFFYQWKGGERPFNISYVYRKGGDIPEEKNRNSPFPYSAVFVALIVILLLARMRADIRRGKE